MNQLAAKTTMTITCTHANSRPGGHDQDAVVSHAQAGDTSTTARFHGDDRRGIARVEGSGGVRRCGEMMVVGRVIRLGADERLHMTRAQVALEHTASPIVGDKQAVGAGAARDAGRLDKQGAVDGLDHLCE